MRADKAIPCSALAASMLFAATAHAELPRISKALTAPVSIDLRDLARYSPESFPQAQAIVDALNAEPATFFTKKYKKVFGTGAAFYGVELYDSPYVNADGSVGAPLIAFFRDPEQGYLFRKLEVSVKGGRVSLARVNEDIPLAKTKFAIRVGLIQRKAILEDLTHGIRKIYPLEVGGFDQPRDFEVGSRPTILLTPRFESAWLQRDGNAYEKRDDKDYYYNRPYLPVTNRRGKVTDIAFHIIQHPQLDDGRLDFDRIIRSFDSHGCMRLREKDLFELSTILFKGGRRRIPVDVDYFLPVTEDHPAPLTDSSWARLRYFTAQEDHESRRTKEHRRHKRKKRREGDELYVHKDESNLTEIEYVEGMPPLNELEDLHQDRSGPDFEDGPEIEDRI